MTSIKDLSCPFLDKIIPYNPGKPIEETSREIGIDSNLIIKLASNENPIGPSPKSIKAMQNEIIRSSIYPDGGAYKLKEAISNKLSVNRDNIIFGNGSNEIIELLGHGFLNSVESNIEVIVSEYSFSVYKSVATLFGVKTISVPDIDFTHDLKGMLNVITLDTRIVFIANPNNPTGTIVEQEDIDYFMSKIPDHVIVVFDEAYIEFLESPIDTLKYIKNGKKVVVMRTFSKIYGLAGLRVGYAISTPEIIEVLQKCRQPFNINSVSQAGALVALNDDDYKIKIKNIILEGLNFIQSSFSDIGLDYVTSKANFVLVKVGDGKVKNGSWFFNQLLKKGIIIRDMKSYGLDDWIRVSIGTMDENKKFIENLKLLLNK